MMRFMTILFVFGLLFQPSLMAEGKVIIAVASEGEAVDASVSPVAARGPYFLLFDSKGELLGAFENPHKDTKSSAGVSAANFLAQKNVTVVVAGNCGAKMAETLKEKNIDFFEFQGNVEEAVKKFLEKKAGT